MGFKMGLNKHNKNTAGETACAGFALLLLVLAGIGKCPEGVGKLD